MLCIFCAKSHCGSYFYSEILGLFNLSEPWNLKPKCLELNFKKMSHICPQRKKEFQMK